MLIESCNAIALKIKIHYLCFVFLVSDENRRLMEEILNKSVNQQQEIGVRVAALLAGTSLTTTTGVEIRRREPIEEIAYETVGM